MTELTSENRNTVEQRAGVENLAVDAETSEEERTSDAEVRSAPKYV